MDIDFIKEQFCRYKCTVKDKVYEPYIVESDYIEFECEECGEINQVMVDKVLVSDDNYCGNCQIENFIIEMRSYGVKI